MLKKKDRLLVIGLGPRGERIVMEARRRFTERWGTPARLAWLGLADMRELTTPLRDAVQRMTRLRQETLTENGSWRRTDGTTRVCIVADPAEMQAEAVRVAEATRRTLSDVMEVRVWGLAVLPEQSAVPPPVDRDRHAGLAEWAVAVGGRPAFDGGLLVVGSANRYGESLAEAEQDCLAAEVVVQWLVGPLAEADGYEPTDIESLSGVGVAAWVYPVGTLRDRLGERIAADLVDAWLGGGEADRIEATAAGMDLLALLNLGRDGVDNEVAPVSLLHDLLQPMWLPPPTLGGLWENEAPALQAQFDARLKALTQRRPGLDERGAALAAHVTSELVARTHAGLDEPTPGAIALARARLDRLQGDLARLIGDARQEAGQRFQRLAGLDAERETLIERMDDDGRRLLQGTLAMVGLALCPWRWPGAWRAARDMRARATRLAEILEQGLRATTDVLRADLAAAVYDEVLEQASWLEGEIRQLEATLRDARQRLCPSQDGLFGAPDFPLEVSVLTPALVEALAATVEPDPVVTLKEASLGRLRLSGWLASPIMPQALAEACRAYGWQRTEPLALLTGDDLLARRFDSPRGVAEALEGLAAAAAPFLRWDETRAARTLGEPPRLTRWLGLAAGERSTLAGVAAALSLPSRVMETGDPTRVLAMQIVRDISLEMVMLRQEVQDGSGQDAPVAVE